MQKTFWIISLIILFTVSSSWALNEQLPGLEEDNTAMTNEELRSLSIANQIKSDGKLDMYDKPIDNVEDPTDAQDAMTLNYADTNYQVLDADLTAIAALANTDSNIIVGNGTAWVAETGATARTSLGAATSGANSDITSITGLTTDLTVAQGGTGSSTTSAARTALGLEIGTDISPYYKVYDSGWFQAASANDTIAKTHSLGTTFAQFTLYYASDSSGTGMEVVQTIMSSVADNGSMIGDITTTTLNVRVGSTLGGYVVGTGGGYGNRAVGGYLRVIGIALE